MNTNNPNNTNNPKKPQSPKYHTAPTSNAKSHLKISVDLDEYAAIQLEWLELALSRIGIGDASRRRIITRALYVYTHLIESYIPKYNSCPVPESMGIEDVCLRRVLDNRSSPINAYELRAHVYYDGVHDDRVRSIADIAEHMDELGISYRQPRDHTKPAIRGHK